MLNKNANNIENPKLDPPGAGLPWHQKLILKYYVGPFVAAKTDWNISEARFYRLTNQINTELEGLTEDQLQKKILVPPQQGLEDSSRYWSIAMALEHLVIVGKGIFYAINELSAHRAPFGKADTAAVKPLGKMSAQDTQLLFERFCTTDYKKMIDTIQDRNSDLKFQHPWFGPMNAKQWFWLLPIHHNIHLKQIREIKKSLALK